MAKDFILANIERQRHFGAFSHQYCLPEVYYLYYNYYFSITNLFCGWKTWGLNKAHRPCIHPTIKKVQQDN
jgi:hypothetical protein